MHGVPVHWDEYIPLETHKQLLVSTNRENANVHKHGLYARVLKS